MNVIWRFWSALFKPTDHKRAEYGELALADTE